MSSPILPIGTAGLPELPAVTRPVAGGFQSVFADAVARVEQFSQDAHQSVDRLLSGESEELHQVALQTQQAELAFELFLQVRNKVVQAYQEVMRLQL